MITVCDTGLYFDRTDMVCRPCRSSSNRFASGLVSGECANGFDTGRSYASVHIESLEYPTYFTWRAVCSENGATALNETFCCPPRSSPVAGMYCRPDDGLFAFHNGTGDYETHFEVVGRLECMARGMVWNA